MDDIANVGEALANELQGMAQNGAPENAPATAPPEPPAAAEQQPGGDDSQYYTPEEREQMTKNSAWASMRLENKSLKDMLGQIAGKLGVDVSGLNSKNTNDVLAQVLSKMSPAQQQQLQAQQPEQPQLTPEMQLMMNRLMSENSTLFRNQTEIIARQGFENVKQQFNLSDADLGTFAEQLVSCGINPYQDPSVDLVEKFKVLNFDKIVDRMAADKAQELFKQQQQLEEQSTSPMSGTGAPPPPGGQIRSVSELDAFLNKTFEGKELPKF